MSSRFSPWVDEFQGQSESLQKQIWPPDSRADRGDG